MTKVTIGLLSYKDKKYLQHTLPTLLNQTYSDLEILICDNNEDPQEKIKTWINQDFPTIQVLNAGGNVGFGRGHNHLMKHAKGDYYLAFNSDAFATPDYVKKLVEGFDLDDNIAVTTGKLLKWSNFPESPLKIKDNYIDSVGLQIYANHFISEIGENQKDSDQFNSSREIWGASGATPMFNLKLVRKIEQSPDEIFDSNFFMYKEDIDLAYRLRWAAYKCYYIADAIAWHDRTTKIKKGFWDSIQERKNRPTYIKENSYLNQLLFTYKNFSTDYSLKTYTKTITFILKYTLFLLLFDFKTLKVLKKFNQLKPTLQKQRQTMPRSLTARQMEDWFQ